MFLVCFEELHRATMFEFLTEKKGFAVRCGGGEMFGVSFGFLEFFKHIDFFEYIY